MSTENEPTPEKSEAEQAFDAYAELVMAAEPKQTPPETPAADAAPAADSFPEQDAATPPAADSQTPPAASVDELAAARAELARLQHQLSSERGRQAALQRELEAERQRKAAEAAAAAPQEPTEDDEEMARVVEDYPEIAAPFRRQIAKLEQQLGRVLTAQERAEQERAAIQAAEAQRLEEQHMAAVEEDEPGGLAFIRSNVDAFKAWVQSADITVGLRDMAERNANRLVDPKEAKTVIAAFKRHMGAAAPANPTPDRRQRQLAGASTPRGAAPARIAPDVAPTDPDKAFDYYAKIAARQMGMTG